MQMELKKSTSNAEAAGHNLQQAVASHASKLAMMEV